VDEQEPQTLYDAVGGMAFFERLVDRFYEGVERDDVLLALYPDHDDLDGARHRLTLFLAQYWGGPQTYSDERGHPRLRMRHAPFAVGPVARDRWLAHMRAGVDELGLAPDLERQLWDYLVTAANGMVNTFDEPTGTSA